MAQIDHFESTEELRRELIIQFLADIMRATVESKTSEVFQSALQAYCDDLRPWVESSDCPLNARAVFSLLENCSFDATGEHITVVLSPEAEAFFRAWLRRNQILHRNGFNTAHAWTN